MCELTHYLKVVRQKLNDGDFTTSKPLLGHGSHYQSSVDLHYHIYIHFYAIYGLRHLIRLPLKQNLLPEQFNP